MLKTDFMHGAMMGLIVGALMGLLFGGLLINEYAKSPETILLTTAMGMLFGAWASSMAAAPNSQLKSFYPKLASGRILMIADVPTWRVTEIESMLEKRHPEMRFGGEETHMPVFP